MAASAASALLPAAQRIARQWRPPDAVLEVEVRAELPLQDERVLPRPSALRFQTRLCCVSANDLVWAKQERFCVKLCGRFVLTSSPENTCLLARATER